MGSNRYVQFDPARRLQLPAARMRKGGFPWPRRQTARFLRRICVRIQPTFWPCCPRPAVRRRAAPAAQVPVYAYAYLPEDVPESAVYQGDGQAWGAAAEIPFAWTADLSGLEDGAHTLTVVVQGAKSSLEKSLAFEKQGGTVRFAAQ